jgi:hypothetical protein
MTHWEVKTVLIDTEVGTGDSKLVNKWLMHHPEWEPMQFIRNKKGDMLYFTVKRKVGAE